MNDPLPPGVTYDAARDVLTVDGLHFSLGAFRDMASPLFQRWMKVISRKEGVITVTTVSDALSERFDNVLATENKPL